MSKIPKKILFVSHDATRTGAPMVLLHFLEWLKVTDAQIDFCVLLKHGGELEDRFRKIAPTYMPVKSGLINRIFRKVIGKFYSLETTYKIPGSLEALSFDAVYLNTIVSLDLAVSLKALFRCPVLCHVHENEYSINAFYPLFMKTGNLQAIDHFVAVSESTRDNLIHHHRIPETKINVVYEFISLQAFQAPTLPQNEIRRELNLTNEFIVGGSGLTSWRKGIDLFVRLAVEVKLRAGSHRYKLVWVGMVSEEFKNQFAYECKRMGVEGDIIFTGSKVFPQNYFQIFDVFVLSSREDPFPLVAIEAASLGKPIICFANSGGIPEFDGKSNGILTVPYGDVGRMAESIINLCENEQFRSTTGQSGREFVKRFDVEGAGRQLVKIIRDIA